MRGTRDNGRVVQSKTPTSYTLIAATFQGLLHRPAVFDCIVRDNLELEATTLDNQEYAVSCPSMTTKEGACRERGYP